MAVETDMLNSQCKSASTCRKNSTFLFTVAWADVIQALLNDVKHTSRRCWSQQRVLSVIVVISAYEMS